MFPISFNFPFRKKDGSMTTIDDAISSGGGSYTLPTASETTKGGIKVGEGLTMDGETLKNTNPTPATPYILPVASDETLGGVKVGNTLKINDEVLDLNTSDTTFTLTLQTIMSDLHLYKSGNMVSLNLSAFLITPITSANEMEIGSIPSGYRPNKTVWFTISGMSDGSPAKFYPLALCVDADGKIKISTYEGVTTNAGALVGYVTYRI